MHKKPFFYFLSPTLLPTCPPLAPSQKKFLLTISESLESITEKDSNQEFCYKSNLYGMNS